MCLGIVGVCMSCTTVRTCVGCGSSAKELWVVLEWSA